MNALRERLQARRSQGSRTGMLVVIERRTGITPSGLLLLASSTGGWFAGRALSSRPVLVFAYGLVLLLVLSWALGRRAVSLEINRSHLPSRVRQNQRVDVEFTVKAHRRIATVVLEEQLPTHLGNPVRFPIPSLGSGNEVGHTYSFTPTRRGRYSVGPLLAEWSDPFGLTRHRKVVGDAVPIIVHPSTEPAHDRVLSRAWEDPPIRPPVSKPWPSGFEFYGMRDYVSGDDPRRIVWRATARSLDPVSGFGRYLVREAEQGITDRVTIYLDTDRSSHSHGETSQTFELAVRAVASVGVKHLKDGFAVSVMSNAGPVVMGLRGKRAEVELLDALAVVERDDVHFAQALDRLLVDRSGHCHNVVVTPHLDRASATRLRLILDRGVSVLLALVLWEDTDPATFQRAGSLGCSVAELVDGAPLERVFRHALGGTR